MAEIDCFMAAIRQQESGGNYRAYNRGSGASGAYQFMPGTWRGALVMAGLGGTGWMHASARDAPPGIQDAAAHALMSNYFGRFHSWYSVAEAWYGGPGAVGHPNRGGGANYPNVGQYASRVISIMNSICGGAAPIGGPVNHGTGPGGVVVADYTLGSAPIPSDVQGAYSFAQDIYNNRIPSYLGIASQSRIGVWV